MAERAAIIKLKVRPDGSIQRAMKGVTDATQKANVAQIAMARKLAAEQKREADRAEKAKQQAATRSLQMQMRSMQAEKRESKRLADAQAKDAKRVADAKIREEERAAATRKRLEEGLARYKMSVQLRSARMAAQAAERSSRAEIREAQKSHREQVRMAKDLAERRRTIMASVAGGVVAGAGAAIARADSYAGAFGAQSREQMLVGAVDLRRRVARVGLQSGMNPEQRDSMQRSVLDVSARTGLGAGDVLAGLETAQAQFSEFGGAAAFAPMLGDLGEIAVATGADLQSVVKAMGVMRRQFGLTEDEMKQLGGVMVDAANKGNIEFADLASTFTSGLGALGRGAGMKGFAGAQTALGVAQVLGASDMTSAEAATRATNLVAALSKGDVRKGLRRQFGVNVENKDGSLRDLPTVIGELSRAGFGTTQKGTRRQEAIRDLQAREAFEILVKQYESAPELFGQLMRPDAEAGNRYVAETFKAMNAGELGQAATLGARQFANFMGSPELDELTKSALGAADALTQISAKYPAFAEKLGIALAAVAGFGITVAAVSRRIAPMRPLGAGVPGVPLPPGAPAAPGGSKLGRLGGGAMRAAGYAGMAYGAYEVASEVMPETMTRLHEGLGAAFYDATNGGEVARTASGRGIAPTEAPALRSHSGGSGTVALDQPSIKALSDATAAALRGGNATLRVQIDGPGRVVGTRQNDAFPAALDTGSAYSPQ